MKKEPFDKADIVVMLTAHDQFSPLPWNENSRFLRNLQEMIP